MHGGHFMGDATIGKRLNATDDAVFRLGTLSMSNSSVTVAGTFSGDSYLFLQAGSVVVPAQQSITLSPGVMWSNVVSDISPTTMILTNAGTRFTTSQSQLVVIDGQFKCRQPTTDDSTGGGGYIELADSSELKSAYLKVFPACTYVLSQPLLRDFDVWGLDMSNVTFVLKSTALKFAYDIGDYYVRDGARWQIQGTQGYNISIASTIRSYEIDSTTSSIVFGSCSSVVFEKYTKVHLIWKKLSG